MTAAKRFEWERIVRRCVLPSSTKLVAFVIAQYGNKDGTKVHPGNRRISSVTGMNEKTVRRSLEQLRRVGLIERVFHGKSAGRRGMADEYRLAVPADLMNLVEMLTPDEVSAGTTPVDPFAEGRVSDPVIGPENDKNTGHLRPGTPDIVAGTPDIVAGTPDMGSRNTGHQALTPEDDHPSITKTPDHSGSWTRPGECAHGYQAPGEQNGCAMCRRAVAPWDKAVS